MKEQEKSTSIAWCLRELASSHKSLRSSLEQNSIEAGIPHPWWTRRCPLWGRKFEGCSPATPPNLGNMRPQPRGTHSE
jgi:hypothetical protein